MWRPPLLAAALCGVTFLGAAALGAQTSGTVAVAGPTGDPIRDGTPGFTITTSGFVPAELPLRITLQLSTQPDFAGGLLADTTVTSSGSASIVVPRLLPERIQVWWRARVVTAMGQPVLSNAVGPRTTATWLALVTPNNRNATTVDTRRPTFIWTSAAIRAPVVPWSYQLLLTRATDGAPVPVVRDSPFDTAYTSKFDLEANTPYRWSVVARLTTGDSIRVNSFTSFVILDPNAPIATVMYRPFPNPFPNARVSATCVWIDLRALSEVKLDVLDLQGHHVARLLPGRGLGPLFPPSRYGRAAVGSDSGCDDRFTWDGRDDTGRLVPAGVYLIRFRGDGVTSTQRVLWQGR